MMTRYLTALCILLAPIAFADGVSDATVYVPITVAAADVDEAYPLVRVELSDLPSEFWAALSAASDTTGATIRVTDSTGATEHAVYVVSINTGTPEGCLIFEGNASASVDNEWRVYAGSPTASMYSTSATYGRDDCFSSFAGFYFPGVTLTDITGAGRDLTAVGTPGTTASAWEGVTAATYNGSSQYHKYEGTQAVTNWPITLGVLLYSASDSTVQYGVSLSEASGTSAAVSRLRGDVTSDPAEGYFQGATSTGSRPRTSTGYTTNTWTYTESDRNGNTGTSNARINAGTAATETSSITAPSFDSLYIGAGKNSGVTSNYLNGNVAAAWLYKYSTDTTPGGKSANYLATEHAVWQPGYYSVGSAVELGGDCTSGSTGWVLFGAAAQTATSAADWANLSDAIVDDANTADVTLDDVTNIESEQILFDDIQYGITPPEGADSYTVTFRVKVDMEGGGAREINDLVVKFVDDTGTLVGDNLASATQWPSSPGTRDYVVTGVTFDGTEFDADTGMAISATAFDSNGNTLTEVYVAWIKIDWDCGDDPTAMSRGFFELAK